MLLNGHKLNQGIRKIILIYLAGCTMFPHLPAPIKQFDHYTVCPTRYRTRHFFNNVTANEDIATKFEADLPHCVRNVTS
jgi:hypothetical protein